MQVHRDFGEELIELDIRGSSDNLRLCYAAVYQSCQGRTLRNQHVMLMDTQHIHFSLRHLYVGASRVTSGEYLHRYIEEQTEAVPHEEVVEADRPQDLGMDEFARDRLSGEGALLLLREAIEGCKHKMVFSAEDSSTKIMSFLYKYQ